MLIAGIIAVIVIGPRRLPHYAQKLGELIRMFRAQLTTAQTRAAQSVGGARAGSHLTPDATTHGESCGRR
ncbi:twin-arginine translocase TatA/TatE family subunit [Brevibacterium zhoupengii]|uniref:twin-arginine translocase TatA/TatE family subunit n=1 Tax=Brevibacterium zhoupengii TaxID=2898795 RepID=UPI00374DDD2E